MKRTLTFIVLCKDPNDSRELGRALSAHAGASLLMVSDDAEQVFTETARLRPSAVIITIPQTAEPFLGLIQRIISESPATAVICASRDCSPDLILRCMRAGACDFLRFPIIEEELTTVIERTADFAAQHVNDEPKKRGRAIAVFSSKGGCGCTFIATNLAVMQASP